MDYTSQHHTLTVPAVYAGVTYLSGYNKYLTDIVAKSSTVLGSIANVTLSTDKKTITADLWYYDVASATRYTTDITVVL